MSDEKKIQVTLQVLEDGPIIVKGLKNLRNSKSEDLEVSETLALCRCGESSNKPFCDGTHKKIGFSGKRENDKPLDKEREYAGEDVSIFDNRVICSHAAECVKNLPDVFRLGERPWIAPDNASKDEIIDVVKKCPSGALSFMTDKEQVRDFNNDTQIVISENGPYNVMGNIEIEIGRELKPPTTEHYSLCRCGESKNKPYCDGSHHDAGFVDEDN